MNELARRGSLATWWSQNRSWAAPAGALTLILSALSLASCAGAVLAFLLGAVKLGTSFRKRE